MASPILCPYEVHGEEMKRRELGLQGEEVAVRYLEGKGYLILGRNYRTSTGEIDVVAQEGETLVFVEVRARSSRQYGLPEESVTPAKSQRLIEVAQGYLQEEGVDAETHWRIDIVALEFAPSGELLRVEHIENAVSGGDV